MCIRDRLDSLAQNPLKFILFIDDLSFSANDDNFCLLYTSLWQCAYAEFYFTPVLFPDFTKQCFDEALAEYAHRDRRMGGNTKKK